MHTYHYMYSIKQLVIYTYHSSQELGPIFQLEHFESWPRVITGRRNNA